MNLNSRQSACTLSNQGETLSDIAEVYATTGNALRALNDLDATDSVPVGVRLLIPTQRTRVPALTNLTVQLSDSLYSVASRTRTNPEQIAFLNQIVNPHILYGGQQLLIPGDGTTRDDVAGFGSLTQIAVSTDSNLYALAAQNGISNPTLTWPSRAITVDSGQGHSDSPGAPNPWHGMNLNPVPLERGRTGHLTLETTQSGILTGWFAGEPLTFFVEDGVSHALIGVNRWTAPGLYTLQLTFTVDTGVEQTFSQQIWVGDGGYESETIRLPEDVAAVLNDQVAVQQEYNYIQQSMTGPTPERHWDGLFLMPATGLMSSAYGPARSYNGGPFDSFHSGSDFSAQTGTPISAPASGIVVDTGFVNVRGFITIIDHGWGVFTGYWHQSGVLVEPGEFVNAGQTIGTVGSTGLSTAAHLHWEMWVDGVQVDPLQWVRQPFF